MMYPSGYTMRLTGETFLSNILRKQRMTKNRNEITGDLIRTKQKRSADFDDHFDAIFGKRDFKNRKIRQHTNEYPEDDDPWDEARLDIIGQNGPTGLHYDGESND
jgi:hypothetical protein